MADTVGVNYQWPRPLHLALKTIAEYGGVTVKEALFRAVSSEIEFRVANEPELAESLLAAGVVFGDDGYPVLR